MTRCGAAVKVLFRQPGSGDRLTVRLPAGLISPLPAKPICVQLPGLPRCPPADRLAVDLAAVDRGPVGHLVWAGWAVGLRPLPREDVRGGRSPAGSLPAVATHLWRRCGGHGRLCRSPADDGCGNTAGPAVDRSAGGGPRRTLGGQLDHHPPGDRDHQQPAARAGLSGVDGRLQRGGRSPHGSGHLLVGAGHAGGRAREDAGADEAAGPAARQPGGAGRRPRHGRRRISAGRG